MSDNGKSKRKNIRFESSPNTLAYLCFGTTLVYEFSKDVVALVIEESFGGCGLIVHWDGPLTVGDKIIVQVGGLDPLKAEIRMCQEILKHVYHMGILYVPEDNQAT